MEYFHETTRENKSQWLSKLIFTFNLEGYKRNKYYLSKLISDYKPLFLFIQERWLPHYEAKDKFCTDFSNYNFMTTSADMFTPAEDKVLETGPTWHGTALGWAEDIDKYVSKIPVISERFCGVKYQDNATNTSIVAYSAYLPTSGLDDEFLETLSQLSYDLQNNVNEKSSILIGFDSNQ